MLVFHEHLISDLLEDPNGGLVILSSGLSLHKLISSLLLLHSPSQGTLLILSATDSQKSSIKRSLENPNRGLENSLQNSNPNPNPSSGQKASITRFFQNPNPNSNSETSSQNSNIYLPEEITSDLPSSHRHSLYTSGSICFITSRILIVDLLTSKIPTSQIAGLIILNAHKLTETCTEAFIVRLLRSQNLNAYIRAFSDKPHAMVAGFSKAERIMKCLYIRKLHLWPRFQVFVSENLEKNPPEVIDIRVPQSKLMKGIQKAVIEAMDACLKELRKTNKVDVEDLTVENGLFKSFDEIVARQLHPIWHMVGKKTKQLISDLKTLRKLVDYLVRYDAVTYLKYLDALRVSEGVRSVWIFADSSHKIFEFAKKRVYQLVTADGAKLGVNSRSPASKKRRVKEATRSVKEGGASLSNGKGNPETSTSSGVVLEEVLEEAPKWKVLREVLEEIEEERQQQAMSREGDLLVEHAGNNSGIVLVACKDERSCMQLEDCITKGPQKVMREEWGKYLLGKVELSGIRTRNKKKSQEPKGFGVLDGVVLSRPADSTEPTSINRLEHNALMAAASEMSNLVEEIGIGDTPQLQSGRKGQGKGREKGKNGKRTAKAKLPQSKYIRTPVKNDRSTKSGLETEEQKCGTDSRDTATCQGNLASSVSIDEGVLREHTQEVDISNFKCAKPLPPVQFYALDSDQHILDTMKPYAIIVYHPDMNFVREIEIYKAENPTKKLKVYFLFYEDSTEVQKFQASIRRENGAFESLIRQKSLMMIPVDQDGRCIGPTISTEPDSLISQNSLTRKAGGRKTMEKEMQVIVDMREFMSSLPNVLHQKVIRIVPVTLEVGDYILSPLICVERKSISDLYQSFASGRLYHQVETMVRYYRIPVLLIEFSQDRSFSFQSASDIGDDVVPTSIISKLSLLVLHFPRLRLLWSRSLHATAEIFASLKANQDEPDESKAVRVGVPTDEGIVEDDVRAENYNTSAVELLRRLPGVTDSNYRSLMDGCKSLAELALLPVERLAELMGGQKAARTLREFLDAKCPTML